MKSKVLKLIISREYGGIKIKSNMIGAATAKTMVRLGDSVEIGVAADIPGGLIDHEDILNIKCALYAENYHYGKVKISDVNISVHYRPNVQHNIGQKFVRWVPPYKGLWLFYLECDDYAR